jgi:rfaE bifunctional protein nucleotidyltransferase chain/domain
LNNSKVIAFQDITNVLEKIRLKGKKIVQCHGTFDLLHPGHIIHFQEAKALGDILVVTITVEQHVNKGPGRPYFNDQLRSQSLAALSFVDYVVLVPYPAAEEAIGCVRPDVYCKGLEYKKDETDVTGNIHNDRKAVEQVGGEIAYVGSVVFSSTRLLNNHFDAHSPHTKSFCMEVAQEYDKDKFREAVDQFQDLKVLVVGDIIFDRYTSVSVQGLTSKNRILSSRFLSEETQAGGALAVFRHLKEFTPNVKLVSLLGTEEWVNEELPKYIHPDEDEILRVPEFTSIIKQRFVEPQIRNHTEHLRSKEVSKLFSINYIDAEHPGEKVQHYLIERLQQHIGWADMVLVMDFGHGVMEPLVRDYVQENASFMALNCQTNSNNHGFNLINRQYRRADSFSLDQAEICLATGRKEIDFTSELQQLSTFFNAKYAWLTRGGSETIGIRNKKTTVYCPSFEHNVIDPIGAGDAFCSLASLAAAKDLPIKTSTFMGQLAGAQAVRIVGNSDSIKKARYLKGAEGMLNF